MESSEQNNLRKNRNRIIDTENRPTAVNGAGSWGEGEKVKGILQREIHRHKHQCGDYKREWGWGEVEEGTNRDGKKLELGR